MEKLQENKEVFHNVLAIWERFDGLRCAHPSSQDVSSPSTAWDVHMGSWIVERTCECPHSSIVLLVEI